MADFTIDSGDLDDLDRRMARFAAQLIDLRPFWPRLVPLFIGWMRLQFETSGMYGGAPWAPLSPGYAAWKATRYPGRGILVAEGDLRRAASTPDRQITARSLTLTVDDPKLEWHQEGTDRMPARPLLFDSLPMMAEREVEAEVRDYIDEIARREGL